MSGKNQLSDAIAEWMNRPFYTYRKISVGPQLTNFAALLITVVSIGVIALAFWAMP